MMTCYQTRARNRSTRSWFPTYVGTVWSIPVGATSRIRSVPVVPAREAGAVEDPEDRPEDVVALHVRGAVEGIQDDGEPTASHRLHIPHLLRGDLRDERGFAQCVDDEVVHPDVELELLLPIHVLRRAGVPPDRELPSDPGREPRELPKQLCELWVPPPRVT